MIQFLKPVRCHVTGLKYHFVCTVVIPIVIKNAAFFQHIVIGFGFREGCQHSKFGQIEIDFPNKIQ